MIEPDKILIETTRTHRARLTSALSFGAMDRRRPVNTNLGRFIGSVVLAAVVCVGCLGFSFVVDQLDNRKEEQALESFRAARSANPIEPEGDVVEDESTGYLKNKKTGQLTDPQTGFTIDKKSGLAKAPGGKTIDPRLDWYVDPETGNYTDPKTGVTIDPETMKPVEDDS